MYIGHARNSDGNVTVSFTLACRAVAVIGALMGCRWSGLARLPYAVEYLPTSFRGVNVSRSAVVLDFEGNALADIDYLEASPFIGPRLTAVMAGAFAADYDPDTDRTTVTAL